MVTVSDPEVIGEPGPLPEPDASERHRAFALLVSVFVIATCGLVYELVAGALASYLLGDSITQFSLVIGCYLSAMGLGSWLSKFVTQNPLRVFIGIEILVGIIGGCSASILFLAFGVLPGFKPLLFTLVAIIGTLVGLEIPLLLQLLKGRFVFRDLVAHVLFLDYAGALLASLLFPFLLVPKLGLLETAFVFGLANVGVALWACRLFAKELGPRRDLAVAGTLAALLLGAGLASSRELHDLGEAQVYEAKPIYAIKTPYQRIVVTHEHGDLRLYLSGHLQFSSRDEHRYHEALVHPLLSLCPGAKRALVLGGGDGLAVRELLKYDGLEHIQLVDLDPEMTRIFRDEPILSALNRGSLKDPRVTITNADAMRWLLQHDELFDVVIIDLPDPSNYSLGKLYSRSFYHLVRRHLSEQGGYVVQSTSPYQAPMSFACIAHTIEDTGVATHPYHCYVPSFGEWGFVLGLKRSRKVPAPLKPGLPRRYLDDATLRGLFVFPADMQIRETEINTLNSQALVSYYNNEWQP